MLRPIAITAILIAWSAQAQQQRGLPVPVSPEERIVISGALDKLQTTMVPDPKKPFDPSLSMRVRDIQHEMTFLSGPIDPTSVPIVGMALSRASGCDDKAWALLQKMMGPPFPNEVRVRPMCVK